MQLPFVGVTIDSRVTRELRNQLKSLYPCNCCRLVIIKKISKQFFYLLIDTWKDKRVLARKIHTYRRYNLFIFFFLNTIMDKYGNLIDGLGFKWLVIDKGNIFQFFYLF